MLQGSPVVGLVPARAGSKGVPRKNLRQVGGISLVGRAVLSAVNASMVDACFVSSDSLEILTEGQRWGAAGHRRRPLASDDQARATDVVSDFLSTLSETFPGEDPFIVYLQPTSPLRCSKHVEACLQTMEAENESISASVTKRPIYMEKLVRTDGEGRLIPRSQEAHSTGNRQDSLAWWMPNGAIYVFRASLFRLRGTFPLAGAHPFWMDPLTSTDVDSERDLAVADALVRNIDAGILDS